MAVAPHFRLVSMPKGRNGSVADGRKGSKADSTTLKEKGRRSGPLGWLVGWAPACAGAQGQAGVRRSAAEAENRCPGPAFALSST